MSLVDSNSEISGKTHEYDEMLARLHAHPHLLKRLREGGKDYYNSVCAFAAAAILMFNHDEMSRLERGKKYEIFLGRREDKRGITRGCITVSIAELGKLSGIPGLPKMRRSMPQGIPFISIIWWADGEELGEISGDNFVTAYPTAFIDQVQLSKQDDEGAKYRWSVHGRETEWQTLKETLLTRFKKD